MPEILQLLLLAGVGFGAGILNILAGGGSFVTVPLLVLLGIPATLANAVTRPAILAQNIAAALAFRRGGAYGERVRELLLPLLAVVPAALLGAGAAALLHVQAKGDRIFELILALVLIVVALHLAWRERRQAQAGASPAPKGASEPREPSRPRLLLVALVTGLYVGFIQAGAGFVVTAGLLHATPWAMGRIHAVKVLLIGCGNLCAILVFGMSMDIPWTPALALLVGQSLGGVIGGRLSLRIDEKRLRRVFLGALAVFAVLLLSRSF
jgi:uncharacterized protein